MTDYAFVTSRHAKLDFASVYVFGSAGMKIEINSHLVSCYLRCHFRFLIILTALIHCDHIHDDADFFD